MKKAFLSFLDIGWLTPAHGTRRLAVNHDGANRAIAVGIATNVSVITAEDDNGGWVLLAPYGTTDYWVETGPEQYKRFDQIFTRAQADKMIAAFNALRMGKGKNFRGLPIYVGHPDKDPVRWPDDQRYGGVVDMRATDGGLEVLNAWNDLGLKNREQGYYVHPSPGWMYDVATAMNTGRILPDELRSVGLTNSPNIKDVPPWTNSEERTNASSQTKNEENNMPKWLIDKLVALNVLKKPADGVEPSEQEMQAAVSQLAVNVAPTEVSVGEKKIKIVIAGDNRDAFLSEIGTLATNAAALNTARDEAKKFKKLAIDHELDLAINDGRLTAAERPQWATQFETDFEKAQTALKEKQPALNTKGLNLRPSGKDLSTPAARSMAYNARVDHWFKQGCKSIDDVIAQMRGNPEDAALLDAMTPKQEQQQAA